MKYKEYTKQGVDINTLPLTLLRGIDTETIEEEEIIQTIVNSKLAELPPEQVIYVNDVIKQMDEEAMDMTPEKEAEYQKIIDERLAKSKEGLKTIDKVIEHKTDELDKINEEIKKEALEEVRFCNFCDSKGVRHKSNCTRNK